MDRAAARCRGQCWMHHVSQISSDVHSNPEREVGSQVTRWNPRLEGEKLAQSYAITQLVSSSDGIQTQTV